jgi:uncharacterized protein (DUF1501 family)
MQHINLITRRGFFDRSMKVGLGVALATLTDIPFVLKRALAEGNIGGNGKKVLFIWLRGANDGLNSLIPVNDSSYNNTNRPTTLIRKDSGLDYNSTTGGCDFQLAGVNPPFDPDNDGNQFAIRLNNGFAALHPSLKFLAPVYNAGDLALIHRVGYPRQSRSHFDSQNYWENGAPNNNLITDGIFYRAMLQAIQQNSAINSGLTGVSIQSALPLILRGSGAAMTNLTDPTRYNLLGIPNDTTAGNTKFDSFLNNANTIPFPSKLDRELLDLQYKNLSTTLQTFAAMDFSEGNGTTTGNFFVDDATTDGDFPYYLFPTTNLKNGGYDRTKAGTTGTSTAKYVVDTGAYGFFINLKAAAMILNQTDAIITGTEFSGFDTHNSQGGVNGTHANLMRRLGWALFSLQKFFTIYGKGGSHALPGARVGWNDVVVVTLSEFGRTTIENTSLGTDHAEAGVMFVAGGAVQGTGKSSRTSGVFCCGPSTEIYNGNSVVWNTGQTGTMFGVSSRYLKRAVDYRSILGEIIRDHMGATQNQLNAIIPGYAVSGEHLQSGGTSSIDGTAIAGELNLI